MPTPQARDWKGHNPTRAGGLDLPGAVEQLALFPTPRASDPASANSAAGPGFRPQLGQVVRDLLPTPEAKSATAGPDYARANRPGSGGDDLVTTICKVVLLATPQAHDGPHGAPAKSGNFCKKSLARDALEVSEGWGKYRPAIERWESLTREAPSPVEPNTKGEPRLSARFAEWMMGWPEGWVTDLINPEPRRKVEGTVSRSAALKMIGNGVVPQQAAAALRLLKDSLDNERKEAK